MLLRWQPGAVGANDHGSQVQVVDVENTLHAALEDPDAPDHVITRDYREQNKRFFRRSVQFQRFVEGMPHGSPWSATMEGGGE